MIDILDFILLLLMHHLWTNTTVNVIFATTSRIPYFNIRVRIVESNQLK